MRVAIILVLLGVIMVITTCPREQPEKVFRTVIVEIERSDKSYNYRDPVMVGVKYRDDLNCMRLSREPKAIADQFKVGDSVRCLKYKNRYDIDLKD